MSVRKRRWTDKNGRHHEAWMIHISYTAPDGTKQNIRKTSPVQTRRGAEQYERELRQTMLDPVALSKEVAKQEEANAIAVESGPTTTVSEFVETFLDEYSRTEGLRPRYIYGQRRALQLHIVPVIGDEQMRRVGTKHFGLVKRAMLKKKPDYSGKTVNNVLAVLSRMFQFWWEREGLDPPRFNAGLLKLDEVEAMVYEPDVYERLVEGARTVGPEELAIVLVMGDAGLRQGELRGLYVSNVRFDPPVMRVQRALSIVGEENAPKGRRNRTVPRLADALREYMRVRPCTRAPQVFVRKNGKTMTQSCVRARVNRAERAAGLEGNGRSHVLRHTFVTELGEGDVPAHVIQALVGHKDLKTTTRYLHLRRSASTCSDPKARTTQRGTMPKAAARSAGRGTEHMKMGMLQKRLRRLGASAASRCSRRSQVGIARP